jgi:hypothetical protein
LRLGKEDAAKLGTHHRAELRERCASDLAAAVLPCSKKARPPFPAIRP